MALRTWNCAWASRRARISSMELQRTGSVRSSSAFSNHELKADAFFANVRKSSSICLNWSCIRNSCCLRASESVNSFCHLEKKKQSYFTQKKRNVIGLTLQLHQSDVGWWHHSDHDWTEPTGPWAQWCFGFPHAQMRLDLKHFTCIKKNLTKGVWHANGRTGYSR